MESRLQCLGPLKADWLILHLWNTVPFSPLQKIRSEVNHVPIEVIFLNCTPSAKCAFGSCIVLSGEQKSRSAMPTSEPSLPDTNTTSAHRGWLGAQAGSLSVVTDFITKGNLSGKVGDQFQSTPICLPNLTLISEVRLFHSWLLLTKAADINQILFNCANIRSALSNCTYDLRLRDIKQCIFLSSR